MKTELEITSGQSAVLAGGTRIQLEDLAGTVTHWPSSTPDEGRKYRGFQSPGDDSTSEFQDALQELEISEQETIHLDVAPAFRFRGTAGKTVKNDRVVLRPAPPSQKDAAQVILYQDESGGLSWHFPDGFQPGTAQPAARFRDTTGRATFSIPTRTAAAQSAIHADGAAPRFRGPITKWGRKIFKVLAIPLLESLLKDPLKWFAEKVEARYRQELIRPVTVDNYRIKVANPFTNWQDLKGKRSLLVVHGIFSNTEGMLSQFPRADMEELSKLYGGRMIALDQLSVSRSPEENARTLLQALPKGGGFEFDILCHSRGGIVARTLVEQGQRLLPDPSRTFPKVFFVATPNSGSPLADADHMVDMIDVFTNLLTNLPDGTAAYSIEVILGIVKLLAATAERELPGLAAMSTTGYIQEVLNQKTVPAPSLYAAAAANYQPDPAADNSFLTGQITTGIIDRIFKAKSGAVANDLVVPYEGVFAKNGHLSFPIQNPLKYGVTDHVWHTDFFRQRRTIEAINQHFAAPDVVSGPPATTRVRSPRLERDASTAPPRRYRGFSSRSVASPGRSGGGSGAGGTGGSRPSQSRARRTAPRTRRTPRGDKQEIRRTPELDFHEQVVEGAQNPLVVRLKDILPKDSPISLGFILEPGETAAKVTVTLRAPGFDIIGDDSAPMLLLPVRDPNQEEVTFQVVARSPGETPKRRELCAEFWHRNACVGSVSHFTIVVPAKNPTGPSDGSKQSFEIVIPNTPRQPCDLRLTITGVDEPDSPPFKLSMCCDVPGNVYCGLDLGKITPQVATTLGEYLADVYEKQFVKIPPPSAGRAAFKAWETAFNLELNGLGRDLWSWLPQAFRDLYSDFYRRGVPIRSILISSYEMIIPWELVIPEVDGKALPPLGRAHVLGRWYPALVMKPEPQRFAIKRFCVLNPRYPVNSPLELPSATREARDLKKAFKGTDLIDPATLPTVLAEVLKREDVHVLHFSGHGEYDPKNANLNTLVLLQNQTLSALAISGAAEFGKGTPFVYLNACHAGATGRVVGHMGGFSATLLKRGCCGVIAPYWPVEDERARQFALELYQKLAANRSLGEALQELRDENPTDLTYRAFAFFGDPWARLVLFAK